MVRIPTPLRSYTGGAAAVEADGTTLAELLDDLDRRHPGLRFRAVDEQGRLRQHMRIFVNREIERDLETPIDPHDDIVLMQALSGGCDRAPHHGGEGEQRPVGSVSSTPEPTAPGRRSGARTG